MMIESWWILNPMSCGDVYERGDDFSCWIGRRQKNKMAAVHRELEEATNQLKKLGN
jgi:hypothetical protein